MKAGHTVPQIGSHVKVTYEEKKPMKSKIL